MTATRDFFAPFPLAGNSYQPPRFVARVVAVDDAGEPLPEEEPADVLSGVVYASADYLLCEIEWIEPVPPGEVTQWLEAAADAVERDG